jgi:hypothetical protein
LLADLPAIRHGAAHDGSAKARKRFSRFFENVVRSIRMQFVKTRPSFFKKE